MEQLNPEILAIRRQLSTSFWRTIWTMPPDLRCLITHLHLCDRTYEELADLMKISPIAVQSLHEKAIEYLRSRVEYC